MRSVFSHCNTSCFIVTEITGVLFRYPSVVNLPEFILGKLPVRYLLLLHDFQSVAHSVCG